MHPFTTVRGAITTAFVLAIVISLIITGAATDWSGIGFHHHLVDRWLHIVAGVMWIGLLWYFNVVQTPGMAEAGADKGGPGGAGINKYIAPRALWWFRWAAVFTWLTGAYYLLFGYGGVSALHKAFTFQTGFVTIGVGAWLGTIMLFNVWVFIWPNQKKILGIVAATDEEKAKARKVALYASRTNFILSIPMLMCMGGQSHGLPF
jgi:Predicted membrane protein